MHSCNLSQMYGPSISLTGFWNLEFYFALLGALHIFSLPEHMLKLSDSFIYFYVLFVSVYFLQTHTQTVMRVQPSVHFD